MEEDGGAGAGDGTAGCFVGVVADEEFEAMVVVVEFHLLLEFPRGGGGVFEDDVPVVGGGGGVIDPEVGGGDAAVGEATVFVWGADGAVGVAEEEDSGGGAEVSFFFDALSFAGGGEAESPDGAAFAESAGEGAADELPLAVAFFEEAELDVGAVPAVGGADDGLGAVGGKGSGACRGLVLSLGLWAGCGDEEGGSEQEEEGVEVFHGGGSVGGSGGRRLER